MVKLILWISAALHILGAIYAAVSVKVDYSNQVAMLCIFVALFAGAVVDGLVACALKPVTEVKYVRYSQRPTESNTHNTFHRM